MSNDYSDILFYTKEDVEEVLRRVSIVMHNRNPREFHGLIVNLNKCGFAFISMHWNKIKGTYYGIPFVLYAQEDLITGEYKHKINW